MNKIGIFVNPERDPGFLYLNQIIAQLKANGYIYAISCGGYDPRGAYDFKTPDECFENASLVLTLGGDGTLLKAAPYANRHCVPLLGINLGHLGFLAEMEAEEIDTLPVILKNGYDCTERMMLSVEVMQNGRVVSETIALNDAVIRSKSGKPNHIVISDEKSDLLDYFCDGFIVASPTGSTAYSMSAGGPILEPRSDGIVVTPICPHTLSARSVVFGSSQSAIYIRVTNADLIRSHLECDGAEICDLHEGDVVRVTRHASPLLLVKLNNKSFYKVLNDKISRRSL